MDLIYQKKSNFLKVVEVLSRKEIYFLRCSNSNMRRHHLISSSLERISSYFYYFESWSEHLAPVMMLLMAETFDRSQVETHRMIQMTVFEDGQLE